MAPLGMVLLVQNTRGNYSVAGVISAVFALGCGVSAPFWGRVMDRRGQAVVIAPLAAVSAAFLSSLAVSTVSGWPDVALVAFAAGTGLTFPPISPAMRAGWRFILDGEEERLAGYALDAVAVETIFVSGPLLLSAFLIIGTPALPLLATAGFLAVGGLGYSLTSAARARRQAPAGDGEDQYGVSPLRVPGVRWVLVTGASMAVGFGLIDVAVAATAQEELGSTGRVGILFAAIAGGSATGGLWYGSRAWRRPEYLRLRFTLAGFAVGLGAVGTVLIAGAPSLLLLLPLLFLTGLCVSPTTIVLANLIDRHGPTGRLSEAQSWLGTSFTTGIALGTTLAGVAVDAGGASLAFLVATAAATTAVVGAIMGRSRWERSPVLSGADPLPTTLPQESTAPSTS
jgi:MFS family permease